MPKLVRPLAAAALATAAATLPAGAQTAAPQPEPVTAPEKKALFDAGQRDRYLLDGTWYFRADSGDDGLDEHFEDEKGLDGWSPVTIPNAWNATDLSDRSTRGSVGWYRKDFRLPPGSRAARWVLRFESVNYRATVFLNGRLLGRHEGAFVPFEVRARNARRQGVNRLVVRVDNRRRRSDLPPAQDQQNGRPGGGWWNYGGLLREAYLRRVEGVDIKSLLARPLLACRRCDARVLLRARIVNPDRRRKRIAVRGRVGNKRARFKSVVVKGRSSRTVQTTVKIRNPRLWQPGDPELYDVRVGAFTGGRERSRYDTEIGIRSLRKRKGRLLLNGRAVELRGASMHEDSPHNGMALTEQQIRENADFLKQLGASVTRAHYPLHPLTLELCDRLGIMVWEQIPFNRGRFGNSAASTESPDDAVVRSNTVRRKALRYLRAAIARDQNHPSVFVWSVANEPSPRPGAAERDYFAKALKTVRRLDPTRLAGVDLAGYPGMPHSEDYARFDAIGLNIYFGWYQGPSGSLDDRNGLRPFLRLMRRYYPRSALFITEFGAEANREGPVDEKGTYAFQRDLISFHLDAYDSVPYVNGAVVWILKDFRTQPGWEGGNPRPSPPVNKKGLVDEYGNRKPAFFDLAERFRDTPPLR